MATTINSGENRLDHELWQQVLAGDVEAYRRLVVRHQSMVTAVAFSVCGNFAVSEEIAQETFWAAWRERDSLRDSAQLRAWLCGIARNLGRNANRKASRRAEAARPLGEVDDLASAEPGPSEVSISREEEAVIWESLRDLPEAYRETLVLFYREGQSVAEVAASLEITEDAARQRLSRGRGMLREKIASLVEDGLRKTRPGKTFTAGVLAGLSAVSTTAKGAVAAKAPAAAIMGTGAVSGFAGGLLGTLAGLGGGWLGIWIPAQFARTVEEREAYLRVGRRMLLVSLGFVAVLFLLIRLLAGQIVYLAAWIAWFIAFQGYVMVESFGLARTSKRFQDRDDASVETNQTVLKQKVQGLARRYRGRTYQSRATLLGLPILDVQVSDPQPAEWDASSDFSRSEPKTARGWIAIGDRAKGVLLAVGIHWAAGGIAIGGRAVGVVSFGGVALGLIALGGLALGGLALGGLGVGILAFGGGAIGYWACGGGAIAWNLACGGFALARKAAFGGAAIARDYALGGGGTATHFNDEAAKSLLLRHPLKVGMEQFSQHAMLYSLLAVVPLVLGMLIIQRLMYHRSPKE